MSITKTREESDDDEPDDDEFYVLTIALDFAL